MVAKSLYWVGLAILALGAALLGVAAFFFLGGFLFYGIADFENSAKPVMDSMRQQTDDMKTFGGYVALPALALLVIGGGFFGLGFTRRRSETLPSPVAVSRPTDPRNRTRK